MIRIWCFWRSAGDPQSWLQVLSQVGVDEEEATLARLRLEAEVTTTYIVNNTIQYQLEWCGPILPFRVSW